MRTHCPLAYLLTFTTYGSWLHGDVRGSRHHRDTAFPRLPIASNARWEAHERQRMRGPAVDLNAAARNITEQVIREVCAHRGWTLLAVHARICHVHVVVSASVPPSDILRSVKAWTSRRLAEAGLLARGARAWTRHASTVYLWTTASCDRAVHYVLHEQ